MATIDISLQISTVTGILMWQKILKIISVMFLWQPCNMQLLAMHICKDKVRYEIMAAVAIYSKNASLQKYLGGVCIFVVCWILIKNETS